MKALEARSRISQSDDYLYVSNLKERIDEIGHKPTKSKRNAAESLKNDANNYLHGQEREDGPSLLQIITDYLSHLKTMALTECMKRFGSNDFDAVQVITD